MLFDMLMAIRPFFVFAAMAFLLRMLIKGGGKKYFKEREAYFQKEHEANFARRHDIPDDLFCKTDINNLPVKDYPDKEEFIKLNNLKEKCVKKSQNPMLHLDPPVKNIDLKLAYGAVNLEKIIVYEDHYEQYIRALNDWAEELIKRDMNDDAETVLNEALNLKSPLFKSYQLITDIYLKENAKDKLISLKKRINGEGIISNQDLLNKVISYIDK